MSYGKNICKALKEIRRKVADDNKIPLEIRECTFEGDCKGTCPYCEAEVRYLERELQKRRALGKAVTLAGITLSSVMLSGCQPTQGDPVPPEEQPPTEKVVSAADSVSHENQVETPPPPPSNYSETETTLGIVFGGIEEEDTTPTVNTALMNEEIPLVEEVPSDLPTDDFQ